MYSPGKDEMEQLPEEEKQESLFDDHQEETVVKDDRLFYKHVKTKTLSKPIDIDQHLKLLMEKQESQGINMDQMQKI